VVKRDALGRNLFKNLVIDYDETGEPQYQENDRFMEMAALIVSEQRLSKNNLKGNFIRHKERQGFVIERVDKDEEMFPIGQGVLVRGKRLDDEKYRDAILSAKSASIAEYHLIAETIRAGEAISDDDRFSYERATLERFYRQAVTDDLIRLDNRGRFRKKVRLFEAVFDSPDLLKLNLSSLDRKRFVSSETDKAAVILTLLRLTPLVSGDQLRAAAVIDTSKLTTFSKEAVRYRGAIEVHLGIQVQADVKKKPVQQLGRILRLIGVELERVSSRKEGGRKVYYYRIDCASLERMTKLVEARKAPEEVKDEISIQPELNDEFAEEAGDN
jgi:hypothetical protein